MNHILRKGQWLDGFRVQEYCKTYGLNNAESYKVVDENGNEAIMKIIIDGCGCVEFTDTVCDLMKKRFSMPKLVTTGVVSLRSIDYRYVVREMSEGVRLSELLEQGATYSWEETVIIMQQVLIALAMLHSSGIIHNDVTPNNVIFDDYHVTLVGLGHLSAPSPARRSILMNDLNPLYMAPETMRKRFSVRSDIFSAGALMYTLIFGVAPWSDQDSEVNSLEELREVRRVPVRKLCVNQKVKLTRCQVDILCKMLAPDIDERYKDVGEIVHALADSLKSDDDLSYDEDSMTCDEVLSNLLAENDDEQESDLPKGFAAVAGMNDLKELLSDEVMYVLKNPEKVKKYRLKVPNGMLFYGPPGCGKSFMAKQFSYEAGLNFMMIKASDIGSTFVHGTQGKIKELFDKASSKAPTILCFDELDGMAPDRTRLTSEAISGEVNEFLSQLNNCSERGVFVIGTTNRPNMIDPAIMRSGRMDYLIYIPMPDEEARKDLFRIYLAGRPCSDDINLDELTRITDGYVASDIEFIVNKAALTCAKRDIDINQQVLMERVSMTRKSVSESDRQTYDAMKQLIESSPKPQERRRIGFVTANN